MQKIMQKTKEYYPLILLLLVLLLVGALLLSVMLGRYPISLRELAGILWNAILESAENTARTLGFDIPELEIAPFWSKTQQALLLQHRLPRILLTCMVGCCLSTAGAAYQGVFQNPMAAPDILGASSGAAFGAALAILLGLPGQAVTLMAFVASLATVLLVMLLACKVNGKSVVGLILAGVMVSSLLSSGTSLIKLVADPERKLPAITYWLMGSFNGAAPEDVRLAILPMAVGLVPLFLLRWRINILALGDDEAKTMGVDARRLRAAIILCATLITAASVSVSGLIGWVGLVIPHFARRMAGNNYQRLMPVTALAGAVFLLIVDDVSRCLYVTEIPIGILTSFIGAPFFIYLLTERGEQI